MPEWAILNSTILSILLKPPNTEELGWDHVKTELDFANDSSYNYTL